MLRIPIEADVGGLIGGGRPDYRNGFRGLRLETRLGFEFRIMCIDGKPLGLGAFVRIRVEGTDDAGDAGRR